MGVFSLVLTYLFVFHTSVSNALDTKTKQKLHYVRIETSLGNIDLELNETKAPVTTNNFLKYVKNKSFDEGHFHRTVRMNNQPDNLIKIQVIQGGPNEKHESDFPQIALERTSLTGLRHLNGTVSMARLGPDTGSSNFFICIDDQPELDFGGKRNPDGQGFAAFGRVIEGMDIVKKIQSLPAVGQTLNPPVVIVKAYVFKTK